MRLRIGQAAALLAFFALLVFASRAAETLPSQLSDAEYWKMISDFSEPNGYFQYEIVTSNEISYQSVLPDLMKAPRAGGAYLGVGPEQNFTYIAALQPKIAFLIDIRRDMMLEHLMYKAVFEMSADRVDFVSNLFSRKRPAQLAVDAPVRTIFQTFATVPADRMLAEERLKDIMSRLKTGHHFALSPDDESRIRTIYLEFLREGVTTFSSSFMSPGYAALMTMTDSAGKNWSYLAANENYDRVRALQRKNLIIPLVGDFGGPKAIRMAGQYLKDHGTRVNVFYISNVEDYIRTWPAYASNVASLPADASSLFIRWSPGASTSLASITDFIRAQERRQ
jgi:hypothetical protein